MMTSPVISCSMCRVPAFDSHDGSRYVQVRTLPMQEGTRRSFGGRRVSSEVGRSNNEASYNMQEVLKLFMRANLFQDSSISSG